MAVGWHLGGSHRAGERWSRQCLIGVLKHEAYFRLLCLPLIIEEAIVHLVIEHECVSRVGWKRKTTMKIVRCPHTRVVFRVGIGDTSPRRTRGCGDRFGFPPHTVACCPLLRPYRTARRGPTRWRWGHTNMREGRGRSAVGGTRFTTPCPIRGECVTNPCRHDGWHGDWIRHCFLSVLTVCRRETREHQGRRTFFLHCWRWSTTRTRRLGGGEKYPSTFSFSFSERILHRRRRRRKRRQRTAGMVGQHRTRFHQWRDNHLWIVWDGTAGCTTPHHVWHFYREGGWRRRGRQRRGQAGRRGVGRGKQIRRWGKWYDVVWSHSVWPCSRAMVFAVSFLVLLDAHRSAISVIRLRRR